MTTDNTAHPAPTPAPVAVPEGIHRGIEPDTEMGGVICSECGWHLAGRDTMQAGEMDERQRQHDEHHAPRPEPVVAPLPSEAVEQACEVMHDAYERAAVEQGWETQARSRKPWSDVPDANKATMRVAVAALMDHIRLVPEDDEDTVRERIAQAIEAAIVDQSDDAYTTGVRYGLLEARRIVKETR